MSTANALGVHLESTASCSSSASRSAKPLLPSTWCEDEVRRPTWRSFLRNQAHGIAAIDMLVVASASFWLLYVMIILATIGGISYARPSPKIPRQLGSPAR